MRNCLLLLLGILSDSIDENPWKNAGKSGETCESINIDDDKQMI